MTANLHAAPDPTRIDGAKRHQRTNERTNDEPDHDRAGGTAAFSHQTPAPSRRFCPPLVQHRYCPPEATGFSVGLANPSLRKNRELVPSVECQELRQHRPRPQLPRFVEEDARGYERLFRDTHGGDVDVELDVRQVAQATQT
ncbi:MAG: hypothetical protein WDA71_05795 [Actinomycetota bacterium]